MSVTHIDRYVCCEMKCFFKVLINLFPKIHRSVLCKIAIDLLYFWDVYDVSLSEENFCRSMARSCRAEIWLVQAEQMSFKEKIILRKKRDSKAGVFLWNLWNFPEQWCLLLKTRNILRNEKFVVHKLAIFNGILLFYCIYC